MNKKPGFEPAFTWRHYMFGYNVAAATLWVLIAIVLFATVLGLSSWWLTSS